MMKIYMHLLKSKKISKPMADDVKTMPKTKSNMAIENMSKKL